MRVMDAAQKESRNASGTSDGNGNLTVSWPQATAVSGYMVEWGTASGVYTSQQNAANNLSLTVKGLASGLTYYFTVESFDSSNALCCFSNEVSAVAP